MFDFDMQRIQDFQTTERSTGFIGRSAKRGWVKLQTGQEGEGGLLKMKIHPGRGWLAGGRGVGGFGGWGMFVLPCYWRSLVYIAPLDRE